MPPSLKKILTAAIILLFVIAGAAIWRSLPLRTAYYTDANTIRQPAGSAAIREILWQPPRPLSDELNSAEHDYEPRISHDGSTLYFVRGKAGRNADIYFCSRLPVGWDKPAPLGDVNSDYDDLGPQPSPDGSLLYFYSDRPGGSGGYDLWVSRRDGESWSAPHNLGESVNSDFNDYGPTVSPDGSQLYFASNRPRAGEDDPLPRDSWPATIRESFKHRNYDLYVSSITNRGVGPSISLTELNTPYNDGAPSISPVGDFLYFASDRPGGYGGFDLFRTRRLNGRHLPPENLGIVVNTPANELDPALAIDGFGLCFSSDRPLDEPRPSTGADLQLQPDATSRANQQPESQSSSRSHQQAGDSATLALQPVTPADHAPDYNLYYTASREVFRDMETEQRASIDWGAIWSRVGPNLLWALLALLLMLLLLTLLGNMRSRRLSLLARCLLASLFAHLALLLLFNVWEVTAAVAGEFRKGGKIQVALLTAVRSDEITSQLRGAPTSMELPQPVQQEISRAAFEPVEMPAAHSSTRLTVSQTAPAPPEQTLAANLPHSDAIVPNQQPRMLQSTLRPPPSSTEMNLSLPSNARPESTTELTPSGNPETRFDAMTDRSSLSINVASTIANRTAELVPSPVPHPTNASLAAPSAEIHRIQESPTLATASNNLPSAPRSPDDFAWNIPPRLVLPQGAEPVAQEITEPALSAPTPIAPSPVSPRSPAEILQPQGSADIAQIAPNHPREVRPLALSVSTADLSEASDARAPTASDRNATGLRNLTDLIPRADSNSAQLLIPNLEEKPLRADSTRSDSESPESQDSNASDSDSQIVATSVSTEPLRAPPSLDVTQTSTGESVRLLPPERSAVRYEENPRAFEESTTLQAAADASLKETNLAPTERRDIREFPPVLPSAGAELSLRAMEEPRSESDHGQRSATPAKDSRNEINEEPAKALRMVFDALRDANRAPDSLRPSTAMAASAEPISSARRIDPRSDRRTAELNPSSTLPQTWIESRDADSKTISTASRSMPAAAPSELPRTDVRPDFRLPVERMDPENPYVQRAPEHRASIVERMGGDEETERAVALALKWLADHQHPSGRWDGNEFDAGCGACDGQTEIEVDVALTGLSLLCFLGADHTPAKLGPYQDHVRRAVEWLRERQRPDGDLRGNESMYSQGIAAIALAEAYGMTREPTLEEPVARAVNFITKARNTSVGGWRYDPGQPGDTSVLGWQVMALKSALGAGIDVSPEPFIDAGRWLDKVEDPRSPGRYAYQPGKNYTPAMTAEGLFVRELLGADPNSDSLRASVEFLLDRLPDWDAANTYYWYYATLALFHRQGEPWRKWNEPLKSELLQHQRKKGKRAGSWDPDGEWAPTAGRIYQTALCTLMLEVYYRYLPMYAGTDARDQNDIGVLHGIVTDAVTNEPLAGVVLRVDRSPQPPLTVESDARGRYQIEPRGVPDFFAMTASKTGYLAGAANVARHRLQRGALERDFALRPASADLIAIEAEPRVHHLGDDRFEGSINSQFQKMAEGDYYIGRFDIAESQLNPANSAAELTLLTKGVQRRHEVRINGTSLPERLQDSPDDGGFGQFSITFDPELLRSAENSIEIFAASSGGDVDDFEFVTLQIRLQP